MLGFAGKIYEEDPEVVAWRNTPVDVYNLSYNKPFRIRYNKKQHEIPPRCMTMLPREYLLLYVGNPKLRNDGVEWGREMHRLQAFQGENTFYFDYWLKGVGQDDDEKANPVKGSRLAVPDFGNHKPNYYNMPGANDIWEKTGRPIPEFLLKLPELPDKPIIMEFSEEEFAERISQFPTTRPAEAVGVGMGPETTLEQDAESSFAVAAITNHSASAGSGRGGRKDVQRG